MKKHDHKWFGPYLVKKVILWNAYRPKLPSSFGKIHMVFSVTLLRPYNADTITECIQKDLPPPVICNGVEGYQVEHIPDSQRLQGKLKYLVCWKRYSIKENK